MGRSAEEELARAPRDLEKLLGLTTAELYTLALVLGCFGDPAQTEPGAPDYAAQSQAFIVGSPAADVATNHNRRAQLVYDALMNHDKGKGQVMNGFPAPGQGPQLPQSLAQALPQGAAAPPGFPAPNQGLPGVPQFNQQQQLPQQQQPPQQQPQLPGMNMQPGAPAQQQPQLPQAGFQQLPGMPAMPGLGQQPQLAQQPPFQQLPNLPPLAGAQPQQPQQQQPQQAPTQGDQAQSQNLGGLLKEVADLKDALSKQGQVIADLNKHVLMLVGLTEVVSTVQIHVFKSQVEAMYRAQGQTMTEDAFNAYITQLLESKIIPNLLQGVAKKSG